MDERRVDRERLNGTPRQFLAARRPDSTGGVASYDQLEAEMIAALGLSIDEFEDMIERYRRTGCTR